MTQGCPDGDDDVRQAVASIKSIHLVLAAVYVFAGLSSAIVYVYGHSLTSLPMSLLVCPVPLSMSMVIP